MQFRLFAESDFTCKRAVKFALVLEAAEKHAQINDSGLMSADSLYQLAATPRTRHTQLSCNPYCWRCVLSHRANWCRFINYSGDECGQKGHLKSMCRVNKSERKCEKSECESESKKGRTQT